MRGVNEHTGPVRLSVYTSQATGIWRDTGLPALVAAAARRNQMFGVTSRLVVRNRRFIQALEGPPPGVDIAYRAIRGDPRHTDIRVLLDTTVGARSFPDCPMDLMPADCPPGAAAGIGLMSQRDAGSSFINRAMNIMPRHDRAMKTVEGLLAAALQLGLRRDIPDITLQAVADEAKIPIKTVHRYFAAPDDLFRLLVRERQLRQLAGFRMFLTMARPVSDADLARDIAGRLAQKYMPAPDMPDRVRIVLLRTHHQIAFEEMWNLAVPVCEAFERCGWRGADPAVHGRVAVALAAMASSAKMAALNGPAWPWVDRCRDAMAETLLTALRGP